MGSRYPIGVYADRPPEEVPFLKSVDVGDNFAAKWARKLTSATNDVDAWLDDAIPW